MIIVVKFNSESDAINKLSEYNNLAKSPSSSPGFTLTNIYKHLVLELYWFSGTECIENGGLNKSAISSDISNQDTEEFDDRNALVYEKYFPEPEIEDDYE